MEYLDKLKSHIEALENAFLDDDYELALSLNEELAVIVSDIVEKERERLSPLADINRKDKTISELMKQNAELMATVQALTAKVELLTAGNVPVAQAIDAEY